MKFCVLVISTLALVACGGGGGGEVVATDFTVNGAVVKGPMAKAKVSVYKATAAGLQGDLLTDVTTNDDGVYTAKISNYDGVVMVVASVVAGQTTMYDESTGQTIAPPEDFILRASFAAKRGDTQIAQINPYTEIATASALSKTGGLTATNVAQANSDMAATMTFNPLTTAAEFDANKKPKNAAAVAVAAVSDMAQSGAQSCTGDQAKKVACVVAAISKKGLADKDLKAELSEKIRVIASSANLPSQGVSDATGTPVTAATPIAQAKAFIGALRSNAKALDATDLSLQTELEKVAKDFEGRTSPIAESNLDVLSLALQGVKYWNSQIVGKNANDPVTSNSSELGVCSFYTAGDLNTVSSTVSGAKWVACRTLQKGIDAQNGGATQWDMRVRLEPSLDANKFAMYTHTRKVTGGSSVNYGAVFPGNVATLQTVRDGSNVIVGVNLSGEISPAISIVRNASTPLVVAPSTPYKHTVALSALATEAGGVATLTLNGSIDLRNNGVLDTQLSLGEGSYLKLARVNGAIPEKGAKEILLKLKGNTLENSFMGDFKIGDFKSDKTGSVDSYMPTVVSLNGSVQRKGVSFLTGLLKMEMLGYENFDSLAQVNKNNERILRMTVEGNVIIPDRPVLKLTLSSTETDSGSQGVSAMSLGQYVQGYQTVNIAGTRDPAKSVTTMVSTTGVKVVLDSSLSTIPLTVGSEKVGEISGKRIDYTDKSYETF